MAQRIAYLASSAVPRPLKHVWNANERCVSVCVRCSRQKLSPPRGPLASLSFRLSLSLLSLFADLAPLSHLSFFLSSLISRSSPHLALLHPSRHLSHSLSLSLSSLPLLFVDHRYGKRGLLSTLSNVYDGVIPAARTVQLAIERSTREAAKRLIDAAALKFGSIGVLGTTIVLLFRLFMTKYSTYLIIIY